MLSLIVIYLSINKENTTTSVPTDRYKADRREFGIKKIYFKKRLWKGMFIPLEWPTSTSTVYSSLISIFPPLSLRVRHSINLTYRLSWHLSRNYPKQLAHFTTKPTSKLPSVKSERHKFNKKCKGHENSAPKCTRRKICHLLFGIWKTKRQKVD